jgi:CII-binding regulator of phage lambda lysogenization HflD
MRDRLDLYAQLASSAGHDDASIATVLNNCWQLKPLHVAKTTEDAIREYQRGLEWYMESLNNRSMFGFAKEPKPYSYFVEHQAVLLGSVTKVTEDLQDYCDRSGINNVICWLNMGGQPHQQVLDSIEAIGTSVIPVLKDFHYEWRAKFATPASVHSEPTV